jgi:hypothetical protein
MNDPRRRAEETPDTDQAVARLCAMATFRDGETSRRQIGAQLDAAQADFARCLAMSGWAIARPLRMLAFGLPMQTSLDDCLLARLRDAGYALQGLDDDAVGACLDSRWEFVRGNECVPARYRPAPSYHDRLRVGLLVDAWRRASPWCSDIESLETIAGHLAAATGALGSRLALPIALLRRAAAETCLDAAADERLRHQLRRELIRMDDDDVRHLAIAAALDGAADIAATVQRYGSAAMRVLLRAHQDRMSSTSARTTLEPRLARLRRELWAPVAAQG